jgi:hypothetical protein
MKNKSRLFSLLIIITLFISACNLPSKTTEDAASTAAAQTVEALLSATPITGMATASFTPLPISASLTPTPLPTATSTPSLTPTTNCNVAQFVTDVTVPDGTLMTPNQAFTKKWRIKNIGTCTWTGFSMVFDSGDPMGGPASKAISTVNPGQEVDLEVNLTAPATVGNYRGYWRINTNGNVLVPVVSGYQGKSFYVDIKVQNPATPTNTSAPPTPTNTTAPPFAVTGVSFVNSGGCGAFTATANIAVNGAGSVTYHWVYSDGATDTVSHPAVVFTSASTQSVNTTLSTSATGTYWIDIYIDTPNRQQFGRASFVCP